MVHSPFNKPGQDDYHVKESNFAKKDQLDLLVCWQLNGFSQTSRLIPLESSEDGLIGHQIPNQNRRVITHPLSVANPGESQ